MAQRSTRLGEPNVLFFPPVFSNATSLPGLNIFADTRTTRIYLDEMQTLRAHVDYADTHGTFPQGFAFSGYLVDK